MLICASELHPTPPSFTLAPPLPLCLKDELVTKSALQEATEALKADLLLEMEQVASAKVASLQEGLTASADEAALKAATLQEDINDMASELSTATDEAAVERKVRLYPTDFF